VVILVSAAFSGGRRSMTDTDWKQLAAQLAGLFFENCTDKRWAVWYLSGSGELCILTARQFSGKEACRQKLESQSIRPLATATHPADRPRARYTFAVILDAGREYREAVETSVRQLFGRDTGSAADEDTAD